MSNVTAAPDVLPPQTFISFAVFAAAALVGSCLVFHRYGSFRRTSVYVVVAVLLGWWLSSLIVFVIPMDVASYAFVECAHDPASSSTCASLLANPPLVSFLDPRPNRALYWIWRVIYWSAYVSIWAVYPLLSSYSTSPEFKQRQRWWRALKENLIYYGLYAAVGLGLMVWVSIRKTGVQLEWFMATAILMGNTFGLFLVIVFLSIGLVRIPRDLWRKSRRHVMLKHYMWHIGDAHVEYEQAKRGLMTVLKVVRNADRGITAHDHNRKYMELVLRDCPSEYGDVVVGEGEFQPSYDGMVALHARVQSATWDLTRSRAVYLDYLQAAIRLEDILEHARSSQVFWRSAIRWSFAPKRTFFGATVVDRLESWYYRYFEQICLKLVALFCAILSAAVVWTEVTIFSFGFTSQKVDLSIFSLLLSSANTPFAVELLVWIPVSYITVCVFSSLFSIRILHYYRFLPGQATNPRTLLVSASYMGRLVPPLVFNYLLMIHCGSGGLRKSAYSDLMGPMTAFPLLGNAFAVFFPMVLVLLVAAVLFNVADRILALFRVKQFQFDDHFDDESIAAGERILRTEREAMGRAFELTTDEEDLEDELVSSSSSTEPEKVRFLPSKPLSPSSSSSSSSSSASGSSLGAAGVAGEAPRKARLPRAAAGLLRSLEAEQRDDGSSGVVLSGSVSSAPLIPRGPAPAGAGSGSMAPGKKVGDEILDF